MTWPGWGRAAFVFLVVAVFGTAQLEVWGPEAPDSPGGRLAAEALAVGMTLPLLWARRWPLTASLVVLGCVAADFLVGPGFGGAWFVMLLAAFALGTSGRAWEGGVGMAAVAALVLPIDVQRLVDGTPVEDVVPGWFIVAGSYGLGRWLRSRRGDVDRLRARAEALERDREEATRAAVAYERARIARELHDLVAHSLAVIVLQAQAAERVLSTDVAAARKALAAIDTTGRSGLAELRRMLELLLVEVPAQDLDPRPGLGQLDTLVDRLLGAGLPVSVSVTGDARPLPAGVDLSAYRIVQEALTNTLKHAGPATATVGITYRPDAVKIAVADDGRGSVDGSTPGHGLIGMRERAALYGGCVEAGPLPGGGFRVLATLPTGEA